MQYKKVTAKLIFDLHVFLVLLKENKMKVKTKSKTIVELFERGECSEKNPVKKNIANPINIKFKILTINKSFSSIMISIFYGSILNKKSSAFPASIIFLTSLYTSEASALLIPKS